MEISKTPKFSRPLPTELLLEQIMCIPLMRLFNSNGPKSKISAINWKFEILRNGRKNAHAKAKKTINEIVQKFNMASRARKVEFEGNNLDFTSLRDENGLPKDEFRKEILLYLCYGGNEAAMLVNNVAITIPILNYIFVGLLLEQLFEFILESPNPFTMQNGYAWEGIIRLICPSPLVCLHVSWPAKGFTPKRESSKCNAARHHMCRETPPSECCAIVAGGTPGHPSAIYLMRVKNMPKKFKKLLRPIIRKPKCPPNPATHIINRLLFKVKNLEEKVATLERENHHLHILTGMKMEPLDEEPMDTLVPGQKFVCGPTSFSVAFELEKLKLND
ncbi:hypothetical protein niasHT_020481 [Heterodera trifolii]|uniref:Uncharacterized protein n=1 Tax=Heterodera trifolii TaxID=157864 RepID=A0ABD2J9Q4_9BILA